MKQVRFTKADGKKVSVNTSHVYRLEEGNSDEETIIVASDGRFTVKGSMDEVEAKLHGETAPSGKRVLNESSKPVEIPQPKEREYKQPVDPENLFSDENYDRPVGTS